MTTCAPEAARVSRVGRCTYSCGRLVVARTGATLEGCLDAALAPRGCVRANTSVCVAANCVRMCEATPASRRACMCARPLFTWVRGTCSRSHT